MKPDFFPALQQAFGAYFHEDFLCDYPNADAVIADLVSLATPEELASIRKELSEFIELVKEADNPDKLLDEIGCCYLPSADGMSVVEWLRKVEGMLAAT
jgi:hypothetical protein